MPRLTKRRLIELVRLALVRQGWDVVIHTFAGQHPAKLEMTRAGVTTRLLLYIWSLTHGGASRSADEYRIQITSGVRSFGTEAGYRTIILGYSDEFGTFVGFDFDRHAGRLGASPSIQISRATIEGALVRGIATQDKGSGEVAVAVRPDRLGDYVENAVPVHLGDLSSIRAGHVADEDIAAFLDSRSKTRAGGYAFGSGAELRRRKNVEARAAAVERAAQVDDYRPGRGHNNPPELLPDEVRDAVADVREDAAAIAAEMKKDAPDVGNVERRATRLAWVKEFLAGTAKAAAKDVQEKFGRAIATGIYIAVAAAVPSLLGLLGDLLREIVRWLQLIF